MGEITKKVSASRGSLCSTVQVEREANDMAKPKKRIGSVSIALLVLALTLPAFAAEKRVLISQGDLAPQKIEIALGEEVIWVNTAGKAVHLEFATQPTGHLFQIPSGGEARVRFQHAGEHKYVIHLDPSRQMTWELAGSVVVK
jgi:plastocyanin